MNTSEPTPPEGQPLHEHVAQRVEAYVKEEPVKAASAAFGIGILLAFLPIGGVVSGICRLLFLLARPLLMVLGVVKIFEHWEDRQRQKVSPEADDSESGSETPKKG
jgi:hypothetical protein